MDRLDRQILQALQLEGRAPFSRLAAVLGVSEQTIARRYRRLHTQGVVRVLGLIDPARQNQARWFVRAQCRPDAAAHLAEVLAARDDVSWVSLTAGGSEVTCATHTRRPEHREELLLKRLPRTSQILSFTAHLLLHRFAGDGPDWNAYGDALTTEQTHHLRTQAVPGSSGGMVAGTAAEFTTEDEPLLDALTRDGRARHRTLATVTGWPESRVARRAGLGPDACRDRAGHRHRAAARGDLRPAVRLPGTRARRLARAGLRQPQGRPPRPAATDQRHHRRSDHQPTGRGPVPLPTHPRQRPQAATHRPAKPQRRAGHYRTRSPGSGS